jgi:tetratricopeptide (TPR) repeat protein
VAFSDPEIDLLREILEEDPDADVLLPLAEELVRRLRWAEAEQVLVDGVARLGADDARRTQAHALLARASLETGRYDVASAALRQLEIDPRTQPELARVELLVLERSGETAAAAAKAERFLAIDPHDVVVTSLVERMSAPTEPPSGRARDPFLTSERAEGYARIGRPDRAVRVYRRILRNTPEASRAAAIELRIRQLGAEARDPGGDDLSEDLTDPGLVSEEPEALGERPRLGVPSPSIHDPAADRLAPYEDAPTPVAPSTERAVPTSNAPPASNPPPVSPAQAGALSEEDEETDVAPLPSATPVPPGAESPHARDRRKRRSLLRR